MKGHHAGQSGEGSLVGVKIDGDDTGAFGPGNDAGLSPAAFDVLADAGHFQAVGVAGHFDDGHHLSHLLKFFNTEKDRNLDVKIRFRPSPFDPISDGVRRWTLYQAAMGFDSADLGFPRDFGPLA